MAAELVAPFHSHHVSFRLDLDIDGQSNSVVLGQLKRRPAPGPRKSIWTLTERAIESESEGQLDHGSLVNRDIVLWLTVGHHHVTQAEDWPVLSGEKLSFALKPSNFFDRNRAVDLRRAPFEVPR